MLAVVQDTDSEAIRDNAELSVYLKHIIVQSSSASCICKRPCKNVNGSKYQSRGHTPQDKQVDSKSIPLTKACSSADSAQEALKHWRQSQRQRKPQRPNKILNSPKACAELTSLHSSPLSAFDPMGSSMEHQSGTCPSEPQSA